MSSEDSNSQMIDGAEKPKTDWQAEKQALEQRLAAKDKELQGIQISQKAKETQAQVDEARKRAEKEGKLKEFVENTNQENQQLKSKLAEYEQGLVDQAEVLYTKLPPSSKTKVDFVKSSLSSKDYLDYVKLEFETIKELGDSNKSEDKLSAQDLSHIIGAQGQSSRNPKSNDQESLNILERELDEHLGRPLKHLKELKREWDPASGTRFTLPIRKFRAKITKQGSGVRLTKENDPNQ